MSQPTPSQPTLNDTPFRYTASLANDIEVKWQHEWARLGTFTTPNPGQSGFDPSKPKFYCLDMFPYPSGSGLHVGHPEGYTATDIISRFKRMKGFNVLHPMGWDAFGLPAEQYAIQTGVHPALTTKKAIDNFRRQLQRFGFSYDWSREFGTIDPAYYKWTQWIFLQLYDAWFDAQANKARPIRALIDRETIAGRWAGLSLAEQRTFLDDHRLVYLGETTVNWCPRLGTVLANDEVIDGKSERGGHPVLRKPMKQWMFRITAYADRLLDALATLDWPSSTKAMQTEWIGRSEGAEIDFEVQGGPALQAGPGGPALRAGPSPSALRADDQQVPQGGPALQAGPGGPALRAGPSPSALRADDQQVPSWLDDRKAIQVRPTGFVARDPYPASGKSPPDLKVSSRRLPHLLLDHATYFVSWRMREGLTLSERDRDLALAAMLHWHGKRAHVYAACVLPDHAHWIVRPYAGESLLDLCESVKKFSATQVNKANTRSGSMWQDESFDHIIRDHDWFAHHLMYLLRNPVEAGLCDTPSAYAWTVLDGCGIVDDREEAGGFGSESRRTKTGTECRATQPGTECRATQPGTECRATQPGTECRASPTTLTVFTTRPDTLFGATYMVIAPEHPLVASVLDNPDVKAYADRAKNLSDIERMENKKKTGVFSGLSAINPATREHIPIWIADYVLMGYGTGAIMAVPAHDDRDHEFAQAFNLPIRVVVNGVHTATAEPFSGEGHAINSANPDLSLDGLTTPAAKSAIIDWLERTATGRRRVNYKFRDWTFSRQRYWGEPFPMVFTDDGTPYPVCEKSLPVTLPDLADYAPVESDDPLPLLGKVTQWVHTTAGDAGVDPAVLPPSTKVRREANTMPGSAGSSWYALRYCDPSNNTALISPEADSYWMGGQRPGSENRATIGGVDLYMGGSEHAVGHLMYARFWHNALFDLGHLATPEPFQKLFHQGLITSFAYQRPDKTLVPCDEVIEPAEGQFIEKATGTKLTPIVAKMSKSLKNVVNPDDVIAEFGADTFRLYEMYMGPLEASKPWNPRDITGLSRFLARAWRVAVDEKTGTPRLADTKEPALEKQLHRTIAKVAADIERLSFNTAIAAMIEFVNSVGTTPLTKGQLESFLLILSPFAPHLAEEVWSKLGHTTMASLAPWPTVDPAMLVDDEVELAVQIAGKLRCKLTVPSTADPAAVEALALADPEVIKALAGKSVKKIIVVPGRLVNIVAT